MKTFLACMACVVFLAGLALTAIPVDAQIGFPATLTPLPTFALTYASPAQATLSREITNTIWWQNAPLVVGNPRPGFVLYIIQMYRWLNDTTNQLIMYSLLLLVVIIIVLRIASRMRNFGKSDVITSTEIQLSVERSGVDDFKGRN